MQKKVDFERLPKWAQQWDFWDAIELKSTKYNINPYHIGALVKTESNGNHLACRYEKNFKWTYCIEDFAKSLIASVDTVEMMQKTSWGLCQVMGTVFFELSGNLEPNEVYRWPTSMLDKKISLEYGCRYWVSKKKFYSGPEEIYAAYNAGTVRYDLDCPENLVNQAAVNRFKENLNDLIMYVRF